jgi:xylulokinase
VEGLLCGLADGLDALVAEGVEVRRVLLIGGGARSEALRRIAPAVLGHPVVVPPPAEYVADGAARQGAWALAGGDEPPGWSQAGASTHEAAPTPAVREQYAACRDLTLDRAERDNNAASPDTIAPDRAAVGGEART